MRKSLAVRGGRDLFECRLEIERDWNKELRV